MTPQERDDLIEQIAAAVEAPCLPDPGSMAIRRKRGREDAELRRHARTEQRQQSARLIRAFKTGDGWCPFTLLERVADHLAKVEAWEAQPERDRKADRRGPPLALFRMQKLTVLAACGWINAELAVPLHEQSIPPSGRLVIRLTEAGRAALAEHRAR